LVPAATTTRNVIGHDPHTVGVGHRGATELLNDKSHGRRGYRLPAVTSASFQALLSTAVANEKRQRQKEARSSKVDEIARLTRREVVRQRIILVLLIAVLVGGAVFLLTRSDSGDTVTTEPETGSEITVSTIDPALAVDEAEEAVEQIDAFLPPPAGAAITGETPCPEVDGSSERTTSFENPPPMCIDVTARYTALMETDLGDITIALDPVAAPQTVNNFVVLARYGYYQDVPFHRIIPEFVIQGGDAVGGGNPDSPTLGGGNAGYSIADELPEEGSYVVGSLAMANSGPDSSSTQFFIITGENGVGLPPLYSLFGQVTEGLEVVEELNQLGTPGAGVPTGVVNIRSVTIIEE